MVLAERGGHQEQVLVAAISRKHPSRDAIFFCQKMPRKTTERITSHDVLEPLNQALLASRGVIISKAKMSANF